jgi:hypothetical protein
LPTGASRIWLTVSFEPTLDGGESAGGSNRAADATCSFGWIIGTGTLLLQSTHKSSLCHRGSVVHAHTDHNDHRIVLLRAALGPKHSSSRRNGKRRLLCVGRRARTTHCRRCLARGSVGCFMINREGIKNPDPFLDDHFAEAYYRAATVWDSRAARLFRRLLEMVRSIIAPQLMHFHA